MDGRNAFFSLLVLYSNLCIIQFYGTKCDSVARVLALSDTFGDILLCGFE